MRGLLIVPLMVSYFRTFFFIDLPRTYLSDICQCVQGQCQSSVVHNLYFVCAEAADSTFDGFVL